MTDTPALVLPVIESSTLLIENDRKYQVTLWKDGTLLERFVKPGRTVAGFAEGLFKFRNIGTRETATWQRLGEELKIAFARPWREGDYVVYLVAL